MLAERSTKQPVVVLSREQIDQLTAACSPRSPTGARNRAFISLAHRCGLRCDEALSLMPADLRLAEGLLVVRHGKGDKARTLGMPPDAVSAVSLWMEHRQGLKGVTRASRLLCKLDGGPMEASYVRHLFKRLSVKVGLEGRGAHAHGLRHAFAQEKALAGVPMPVLRDMLGHSSVATTERYLRQIAPVLVIDAMREG